MYRISHLQLFVIRYGRVGTAVLLYSPSNCFTANRFIRIVNLNRMASPDGGHSIEHLDLPHGFCQNQFLYQRPEYKLNESRINQIDAGAKFDHLTHSKNKRGKIKSLHGLILRRIMNSIRKVSTSI